MTTWTFRCTCLGLGGVKTQEKACRSDSRFRRKLSGTTGHRLLGTQRPQMLCVAAWVWFCLSADLWWYTEFVGGACSCQNMLVGGGVVDE